MEVAAWRTWEQLGAESWDSSGGVYPNPLATANYPHAPEYGHGGQYSHDHQLQMAASPFYGHGHGQLTYSGGFHLEPATLNPQFQYSMHCNSVARRNERERNRVRFINKTFSRLRQRLPCSDKKKLSKVDTLRTAIKYIKHLQHILDVQEQEEAKTGSDVTESTMAVERLTSASIDIADDDVDSSSNCSSLEYCQHPTTSRDSSRVQKSGSVTSGTDCSLDLDDDLESEHLSSSSSPLRDVDDEWLRL